MNMGMIAQLLEGKAYTGTQFMTDLRWLTLILVSIAGALMTLYAVYIGYLFATATDEGKRRAAKNRLFKVLGSALIIFAMAAVLKTLDIKFTEVEENNSNGALGSIDWSKVDYEYAGSLSLTMKLTEKYSLTLQPGSVRMKDSTQGLGNVKFTGFAITTSGWPGNAFAKMGSAIQMESSGALTYNYMCEIPAGQDVLTVNVLEKEGSSSYYVEGRASFEYGNTKGCSVSFYIAVSKDSEKIHWNVIDKIK